MENLTLETKLQAAMQFVIMDAIEKGHTNKAELMQYMETETFETAVRNYIKLMNS